MATSPRTPIAVSDAMKKAGAAAIAGRAGSSDEELAERVYRAMAEAEGGVTRLAQDEVAAATVADGGGDERKKPKP